MSILPNFIPFLRPNLVNVEKYINLLQEIDQTNIYSNYGPINTKFEQVILSDYFHNRGSVTTVNNATSGLILAISESKRKNARYAIMPSFTFAATPLAAIWSGLTPYFLEVSPGSWSLDEKLVENALQELGDEVAVVVPYATFGSAIDLTYYNSLQERGIPVVVDAAASFGTNHINGQFGIDFSGSIVFSFHATKAFPVGEGGLVYSSNTELVRKIRMAGNFGFDENRSSISLGLNSKMTEYTAAIGIATLEHFSEKVKIRQEIYKWYKQLAEGKLLSKGWGLQETQGSIAHQFMPMLCPKELRNNDIVQYLLEKGIQARTYFSPACHQQELFISCPKGDLSFSEDIASRIISLPLWEGMKYSDVEYIIESLNKVE
ncbi:DegT/DnrJ/EryC1/StrS family aminotransferase [Brevibacillus sp. HB1.2]|nr:DegT/DnrJ/EryC1/StrS family aminotransferase [Brevibacillus sp. HB1.2]